MKKLLFFISCFIPALTLSAQSMYIYQDNIATVVNAPTAGDMTYGKETLTVQGITFPLTAVDSIIFKDNTVPTDSVIVEYAGNAAKIYVPIQVSPYLTVTTEGAHVSIASSQTNDNEIKYALKGASQNGSFYQTGAYKCSLYLNGVSLASSKGAAINIDNGKRINVYVADGTTNSLTDCTGGTQAACFRIKGHAEFRGNGTLNIAGNSKHAYKSNEYTILKKTFGGIINITKAANDAMHISQYFEMNNGNINIKDTAGDGIQCDTTDDKTDELNGQLILNGGNIVMTLNGDNAAGLKSDSLFTCTGGTYTITMNGKNSDGADVYAALINDNTSSPNITITQNGGYLNASDGSKKKSSCFKTESDMRFLAGTMNVYFNKDLKAKGVKVGGNYYYTAKAKLNVSPDVEGSLIPVK